jgi:hypothetical protein
MRLRSVFALALSASALAACGGSGSSSTGVAGSGGHAGAAGHGGHAGGHAGSGGGQAGTTGTAGNGGSAGTGAGGAAAGTGGDPDGGTAGGGANAGSGGNAGNGGSTGSQTVSLAGTVTGLTGTGLVLTDGLGHQQAITADGTFMFATKIDVGGDVAVTVAQQPASPTQTCVVTGGMIAAIAQDESGVTVTCTTNSYKIAGTVTGLVGSGLTLRNNGGDDLPISGDGGFMFPTSVASGATFTVTVKTQPTGPEQTCQLSGASGTVGGSDVTGVVVNCATNTYTVGGTVTGLAGGGLVLQNNAGNDLPITGNGSFAFSTPIASGGAFSVTVKAQPTAPVQICAVSQASGTVASGNVTTVAVTCATDSYAVGGTVTGLTGGGLVLQNNLGDNLSVTADGTFTFGAKVPSGAMYGVTVLTQPSSPAQTCAVAHGSGHLTDAAITDVAITCTTNHYTVGGTVIGLMGSGLTLHNGSDDLAIAASGAFTFATPVASGAPFAVTIAAQPSNPSQTCTLSGASGTVGSADVTSVIVNCSTDQHVVGGTVSGLGGSGLHLALNGGTPFAVGANGSFAFPMTLPSGDSYAVTIAEQPSTPWQTCTVTNGSGTIGGTDVADVAVACTTNSYTIGGHVTGLAGSGLVLRNNNGDDLPISTDGTFTFATKVASGGGYAVAVAAQPTSPWQTCTVAAGSGGVAGADVSSVMVTCTTNTYPVGGTITGLAGTVVLSNGAGENVVLTANGHFAFPTALASGTAYAVAVDTQPTSPYQTCAVSTGSGTIMNAAVTDVTVTCLTNKYTVGGTIIGLVGSNLVLENNAGDDLVLGPTGSFTFPTALDSGSGYAVTIKTQPSGPTQTCSVGGGTGTVVNANVTTVTINCSTNSYLIGGTITGLVGSGLVLQNNGGGDIAPAGSGTFTFSTPVQSGAGYNVTVKSQPTGPWQTCTAAANAMGTVTNANVSVAISCVSNPYPISVMVTGLSGSGFVLQNNAADNLSVTSNSTFTFATPIKSGLTYAVTVLSQPTGPSQTCTVTSPAGSVAGGPVTLAVSCVTNTYTVGGTVTGLKGSGLVLRDNGGDDRSVSGNGNFTFATPVASGATYNVTVATQPSSPGQSCIVSNGMGTVGAGPVTTVTVSCADVATCGEADENQTLTLSCPTGRKILSIDFASYGKPTGMCGAYVINSSCDAASSVSNVKAACMGKSSCSIDANNTTFGDPCYGLVKHLYVQASCS